MTHPQGTPYDPPAPSSSGADPLIPGSQTETSTDPYASGIGSAPPGSGYGAPPSGYSTAASGYGTAASGYGSTPPTYGTAPADYGTEPPSTTDVAKDEAGAVKDTAVQGGKQVAETAKAEAGNVAAEAKQQARTLVDQTAGEIRTQAKEQQRRAAGGLSALADELSTMADSSQSGPLGDLARQAADKGHQLATYLENHDSSEVLDQVRSFARRRPFAFLIGAAVAGVVVGRFARGLAAEAGDAQDTPRRLTAGPGAAGSYGGGPNSGSYLPDASAAHSGTGDRPASLVEETYGEAPASDPTLRTAPVTGSVFDQPYEGRGDLNR